MQISIPSFQLATARRTYFRSLDHTDPSSKHSTGSGAALKKVLSTRDLFEIFHLSCFKENFMTNGHFYVFIIDLTARKNVVVSFSNV